MKITYTMEREMQNSTNTNRATYKITAIGWGSEDECLAYLAGLSTKTTEKKSKKGLYHNNINRSRTKRGGV